MPLKTSTNFSGVPPGRLNLVENSAYIMVCKQEIFITEYMYHKMDKVNKAKVSYNWDLKQQDGWKTQDSRMTKNVA